MAEKCEEWGISVISVEIRNIKIPKELQDSLAREAQAERERDARVLLADVEREISEMYVEAARVYNEEPGAMQLRAMNLSYEAPATARASSLRPAAWPTASSTWARIWRSSRETLRACTAAAADSMGSKR